MNRTIHAIVESVNPSTETAHNYHVDLCSIDGNKFAFRTDKLFTTGDFVSYEIVNGWCVCFAPFNNDHKVRLASAYQNARIQNHKAQDAQQSYQVFLEDTNCRDSAADAKNGVNGATTAVTGIVGPATLVAGIVTVNPLMMFAGVGMLGGTASAIKDTADNDAEKRVRQNKLNSLRSQVEHAVSLSKQADSALETLFDRFRQEALQEQSVAA